jgi:transcriptional regulator GlxA family with amidase domain
LFQLFKQNTGLTPNDYLQRLRIAKARELLTTTSQSVTEIAFAAGFASSQYFSRVFRKYTGQMPSEYRRRHRQG